MGKQNIITIQLLAITGMLMSILVSMIAFRYFSSTQSMADLSIEVDAKIPYLRLVDRGLVTEGNKRYVTVSVLANTGGSAVIAVDSVIQYNPDLLGLADADIVSTGILPVRHVSQHTPGRLDVSVFANTDDTNLLQTNADTEIAVIDLKFEILDVGANITPVDLIYTPGEISDSNMILDVEPRPEFPQDILQDVRGVILTLK